MPLYELLGISKDASEDAIKKAWRAMSSKAHPDREGSHEKQQELNNAKDVLLNPDDRAHYDKTGESERDRSTPKTDTLIVNAFHSKLNEMIDAITQETVYGDLLDIAIKSIELSKDNCITNIKRLEDMKAKLNKLVDRIKKKKAGNNAFNHLIAGRLNTLEETMKKQRQQMEVCDGVILMFMEYEDAAPIENPACSSPWKYDSPQAPIDTSGFDVESSDDEN